MKIRRNTRHFNSYILNKIDCNYTKIRKKKIGQQKLIYWHIISVKISWFIDDKKAVRSPLVYPYISPIDSERGATGAIHWLPDEITILPLSALKIEMHHKPRAPPQVSLSLSSLFSFLSLCYLNFFVQASGWLIYLQGRRRNSLSFKRGFLWG